MNSPLISLAGRARRGHRSLMILLASVGLVVVSLAPTQAVGAQPRGAKAKPTIVLVHGAWADASNWAGVVERLQHEGYMVYAIANPLRSLSGDAASVRAFLQTVKGPVVLVGHSYGGAVITNAATGLPNVEALVYVNAFAPDAGESAIALAGPESALSVPDPTTVFDFVPQGPPTPQTDLYLKRSIVFASFATGLNDHAKGIVFASQRAATLSALSEPSGPPAWRSIPSWYLIGSTDKIVPPGVERTMAHRAGVDDRRLRPGAPGPHLRPEDRHAGHRARGTGRRAVGTRKLTSPTRGHRAGNGSVP